jgi:hypothetical protein
MNLLKMRYSEGKLQDDYLTIEARTQYLQPERHSDAQGLGYVGSVMENFKLMS